MEHAERMPQGVLDVVIARAGEEIVCPRGTLCGSMVRDANDRISEDDFLLLDGISLTNDGEFLCACCKRIVAVRDDPRSRVHLRRGWVQ
jgi:hypothetical protein